jgi:hypothetical protein
MTTFLLWLACTPSDPDAPGGSEPVDDTGALTSEPTPTDPVEPTGDTGVTPTTTLAPLNVTFSALAPGVFFVAHTSTDPWDVVVEGRVFSPADDALAAVWGFRQGRELEVVIREAGVEVERGLVTIPAEAEPWSVEIFDAARSAMVSSVVAVGVVDREGWEAAVQIIDGADGGLLWWHNPGEDWDFSAVSVGAQGGSFVWGQYDADRQSGAAQAVELSIDGRSLTTLDTPDAHHVAIEGVDGRFAWLEREVYADVATPIGLLDFSSDRIVEANADGSERKVLLSAYDELFGGRNDFPCEHSMAIEDLFGYNRLVEWSHGNSLVYLPESDAYLAYLRWVDTIVKVNRAGEIVWVLSGPWSDFTDPAGLPIWRSQDLSPLWSHGHFTEGWEGGVLVFDNGNHSGRARVVEVALDEVAMTAEVVWSFNAPDNDEHDVLGDARRLPNGNVLINWTVLGLLQEVTRDGDVVWQMHGEPELWFSRVLPYAHIDDLMLPPY